MAVARIVCNSLVTLLLVLLLLEDAKFCSDVSIEFVSEELPDCSADPNDCKNDPRLDALIDELSVAFMLVLLAVSDVEDSWWWCPCIFC